MTAFTRADNSVVGRWWWTVDRWTLLCVCLLISATGKQQCATKHNNE